MYRVSKVRYYKGKISDIMLNNGTVVDIDTAVQMCVDGEITGVTYSQNKSGYYLKTLNNGIEADNLSNYPRF